MWPFTSPAAAPPPAPAAAPIVDDAPGCPVDHSTRMAWLKANPQSPHPASQAAAPPPPSTSRPAATSLSEVREVSSIPRWRPSSSSEPTTSPIASTSASAHPAASAGQEEKWIYPSPSSFHRALVAKQRDPNPADMPVVVPIHNAVNERVWQQVLEWEREAGAKEGESRLVSFVGRPQDKSPRAIWKGLIGYSAPFDRHDWLVDRRVSPDSDESIRVRYVIDFYTGRLRIPPPLPSSNPSPGATEVFTQAPSIPNLSFYIDCRPALDDYEGVRMRATRFWGSWFEGKTDVAAPRAAVAK